MIRLLVNGQMFRENYAGVQLAVSDAKFLIQGWRNNGCAVPRVRGAPCAN